MTELLIKILAMLKYKLFKIVPRWFLLFLLLFIVVFFILPRLLFAYKLMQFKKGGKLKVKYVKLLPFLSKLDETEFTN